MYSFAVLFALHAIYALYGLFLIPVSWVSSKVRLIFSAWNNRWRVWHCSTWPPSIRSVHAYCADSDLREESSFSHCIHCLIRLNLSNSNLLQNFPAVYTTGIRITAGLHKLRQTMTCDSSPVFISLQITNEKSCSKCSTSKFALDLVPIDDHPRCPSSHPALPRMLRGLLAVRSPAVPSSL